MALRFAEELLLLIPRDLSPANAAAVFLHHTQSPSL